MVTRKSPPQSDTWACEQILKNLFAQRGNSFLFLGLALGLEELLSYPFTSGIFYDNLATSFYLTSKLLLPESKQFKEDEVKRSPQYCKFQKTIMQTWYSLAVHRNVTLSPEEYLKIK